MKRKFSDESVNELIAYLDRAFEGLRKDCLGFIAYRKKIVKTNKDEILSLNNRLDAAKSKLQDEVLHDAAKIKLKDKILRLNNRFDAAKSKLHELEKSSVIWWETKRKILMNFFMEWTENIQVYCRVRPLLHEDGATEIKAVSFSAERSETKLSYKGQDKSFSFSFDRVLMNTASQGDVFSPVYQFVSSVFYGYKLCIFANGETGSGKTYTMIGKPGNSDQKGIIERAVEQIFEVMPDLENFQGRKYIVQVSMLEIYKEQIYDMLSSDKSSKESTREQQYTIEHYPDGNTNVSGLTLIQLHSPEEISNLLEIAAQRRYVGSNQINHRRSSKSHLVVTLKLLTVNESMEQQVHGILNFVDLAGSDRSHGRTYKSLQILKDVMFALARKESAPFEKSKLTQLLQPCLSGNSKIMMIVNISPAPSSTPKLLRSLEQWSELRRNMLYKCPTKIIQ